MSSMQNKKRDKNALADSHIEQDIPKIARRGNSVANLKAKTELDNDLRKLAQTKKSKNVAMNQEELFDQ